MTLLDWFESIDREEYIWIMCAFAIVIIPGYLIGFLTKNTGILSIAIVVTALLVVWNIVFFYSEIRAKKADVALLKDLPSFPVKDFCDHCGLSLEDAVKNIDGDILIIICPHCHRENHVVKEDSHIKEQLEEKIEEK